MYNYQQYIKDNYIKQKYDEMQTSFIKESQHRQNINHKMSTHHQKRINTFLLSMIDKPIQVQQFKNKLYEPRGKSQAANRTSQSMRLNAHTAAQRLRDIQQKHKYLDQVPFNNASNHKFRDGAKSSKSKPIKLSSSSTAVRLYNHLLKNRTNQVEMHIDDKTSMLVAKTSQKQFGSNASPKNDSTKKQALFKSLMPSLHKRTYFKSLNNLLVDWNSCKFGPKADNSNNKYIQITQKDKKMNACEKQNKMLEPQLIKNNSSKAQSMKLQIGIQQSAIQALVRCKVIKKNNKNIGSQPRLNNKKKIY